MTAPIHSNDRPLAVVILAAGQGTRMKSGLHKVLHPVAGRPMLLHLLATAGALKPERQVVVVGAGREQVEQAVSGHGVAIAVQSEQLGTGHAVMQAKTALEGFAGDVLILYGDVPLVSAETMRAMLDRLSRGDEPRAVVLGFRPEDTAAYGRIIADGQGVIGKMVEYKDASAEERAVTLCNSGLMAVRAAELFVLLDSIGNANAAGEYYLPDIVMLPGASSAVVETQAWEVAGVNNRAELAGVEQAWRERRRAEAMRDGASLIAPETVWFSYDTQIGRDVTIEPNVVFGPGVFVEDGVVIHAFSHLEGARVASGASVGPYARLRPGAVLEANAKVGNFVEVKAATIGAGAKVSHLSYIGDATVGAEANIGAGTITCNYDGFFKYRTVIGAGAFVGSNSALVAPVTIGDGAIVGAGSVVTSDVSTDALVLVRPAQEEKAGWAMRFRDRMKARKAALPKEADLPRWLWIGGFALIACAFLIAFAFFQSLADPAVRRVTIAVPGLHHSVRIALLSDSHVSYPDMPPARVSHIVDLVNAHQPDLVLLGGDYVGGAKPFTRPGEPAEAIAPFARLRAPLGVLAVLGNHDSRSVPEVAAMQAAFSRAGVTLLRNRIVAVAGLNIAGITNFYGEGPKRDLVSALKALPAPRVLLSHNPDIILGMKDSADLLLAGHTHCGQIRLFGIPWTTSTAVGRRLYCGAYQMPNGLQAVVSGGLGTSRLPLRLFTPPEFLIITLTPVAR